MALAETGRDDAQSCTVLVVCSDSKEGEPVIRTCSYVLPLLL